MENGNVKRLAASAALLLATAGGCVKETKNSRISGYGNDKNVPIATEKREGPWDAGGDRTTIRETIADSPCAQQLQDLGGYLLLYAKVNHAMPAKLEDVRQVMGMGEEIKFSCSASHRPYLYVPNGLRSDGVRTSQAYEHFPDAMKRDTDPTMVVVLADPEPAHSGARWCVFMSPARPGRGRAIDVRIVPEPVFRTFIPVTPIEQVPVEQGPPQQNAPMGG